MGKTVISQGVHIDDSRLKELLEQLKPSKIRGATKAAIRTGLNVIKREAVKNYKSAFPGSDLYKGIKVKAWRSGRGGVVTLGISRNRGERYYILHFLEGGTEKRKTKKGYNRGAIYQREKKKDLARLTSPPFFFRNAAYSKLNDAANKTKSSVIMQLQRRVDKYR